MGATLSEPDLIAQNEALAQTDARARVRWALDHFGEQLVLSTSFGVQAAVMLHLVTTEAPRIPVIWIDTGYHFPETYRFADALERRLDLNLHVVNPRLTAARQEALYGRRWENGRESLEAYNRDNKVEPMNRALVELGAHAWLSGLRRSQGNSRARLEIVAKQNRTWKVHPILDWDNRRVHEYLTTHDLPYHPLWEEGYVSIGDWHSTTKLSEGMSEEETRFGGLKRECGLHELSGQSDWQI
jgi:phosphoadenosine phosphosulfate reductase